MASKRLYESDSEKRREQNKRYTEKKKDVVKAKTQQLEEQESRLNSFMESLETRENDLFKREEELLSRSRTWEMELLLRDNKILQLQQVKSQSF